MVYNGRNTSYFEFKPIKFYYNTIKMYNII
jgi:hypothetical protein